MLVLDIGTFITAILAAVVIGYILGRKRRKTKQKDQKYSGADKLNVFTKETAAQFYKE